MSPQKPCSDSDLYDGWTDKQLVAQVTSNAGAAGAGAQSELTRRLIIRLTTSAGRAEELAIAASKRGELQSAELNRLTRWLVGLTVALVILTLILIYKAFV